MDTFSYLSQKEVSLLTQHLGLSFSCKEIINSCEAEVMWEKSLSEIKELGKEEVSRGGNAVSPRARRGRCRLEHTGMCCGSVLAPTAPKLLPGHPCLGSELCAPLPCVSRVGSCVKPSSSAPSLGKPSTRTKHSPAGPV